MPGTLQKQTRGSQKPLNERHSLFVWVIETVRPEQGLPPGLSGRRVGAPEIDRKKIGAAFLAKAVFNLNTTKALREYLGIDGVLRRLCGWERKDPIPSESTFSRAFATFAQTQILDRLHQAVTERYLSSEVIWHVSRDAPAIEGREKPERKPPTVTESEAKGSDAQEPEAQASEATASAKRRPGRPRKGEDGPRPEPPRIEKQRTQTLEQAVKELPTACD